MSGCSYDFNLFLYDFQEINYFLFALELPNYAGLFGSTQISGVKRLSVAFHQPSLPFKPFWDAD